MANNKVIENFIKDSFENLSRLLVTNEEHLSPVFLAISSYNREMGDWFIQNFLKPDKTEQHI